MRYILNSAVITTEGTYEYKLITTEQATEWLKKGAFYNTLGYAETCEAFYTLFGVKLEVNRQMIKMDVGDEALVFRLTCRLEDAGQKGKLNKEFVLKNCELGILKKIK